MRLRFLGMRRAEKETRQKQMYLPDCSMTESDVSSASSNRPFTFGAAAK